MHELDFSDGNLSAAGGFWFREVLQQDSRHGGLDLFADFAIFY
jgi:hypothetical protein